MFCIKCGAQNGNENVFCVNCGTSLQSAPPQAPKEQTVNYTGTGAYPPPQPGYYAPGTNQVPGMAAQAVMTPVKKPNYKMIGIVSVAAVAVIIIVVILLVVGGGGGSVVGTWVSDPGTDYEMTFTFTKDGIITVEADGYDDMAKYQIKGNKITIITEDGEKETAQFEITKEKGKTVLIMTPEDDDPITLYKK